VPWPEFVLSCELEMHLEVAFGRLLCGLSQEWEGLAVNR